MLVSDRHAVQDCSRHGRGGRCVSRRPHRRWALAILEQVSPYLRSCERIRAKLALDKYVELTPRNGRYPADLVVARERFERDFLRVTAVATRREILDLA